MKQAQNRISNEAVKKATGRTIEEWVKVLDKAGATKMTHKEIAALLYEKKLIKSGWWCQMVTVAYEYAKGRRVVGNAEGVDFEIGAQKTLSISPKEAWDLLLSPKGLSKWLGNVPSLKLEKGEKYRTKEGTEGEIRSLKKGFRLRMTLRPKDRKSPTTFQFYTLPAPGGRTAVHFHQEKLSGIAEREKMRKYWKKKLDDISRLNK